MGVHIVELKKTKNILNRTKLHFPKIVFHCKNRNYSKLLNVRTNQIKEEILYLKNIYKIFKKILENNMPKIIILNMVRGINGYFSAFGKKFKIPCFYISHGTLSKTNNFYSDAYNKILSEELISAKDNIFCLQSKISKKFADSFRINKKNLATGNLIFSDTRKKKQKYLLYAVTNRNFYNMQFYGVETFYEYFNNLIEFDKIAKNYNLTVIIKLHPSISHLQDKLEAIFKNMSFSNRNLEDLLTNAIATISFSSSAIEDSLCSHIPVILLDNWNRYKHCSSEVNPKAKNKCIYYVKNFGSLLKAYNSIIHSSDISFDKFVFKGRSEKNLKDKIFLRYLN